MWIIFIGIIIVICCYFIDKRINETNFSIWKINRQFRVFEEKINNIYTEIYKYDKFNIILQIKLDKQCTEVKEKLELIEEREHLFDMKCSKYNNKVNLSIQLYKVLLLVLLYRQKTKPEIFGQFIKKILNNAPRT
jgi:hypothetical protein